MRPETPMLDPGFDGALPPLFAQLLGSLGQSMEYAEAPEAKTEFDRNGFVVMRNFLPAAELQQLQAALERYIKEDVPNLDGQTDANAPVAMFHDRERPETLFHLSSISDQEIRAYADNDRWTSLASALLGKRAQVHVPPEWFNKPPGEATAAASLR